MALMLNANGFSAEGEESMSETKSVLRLGGLAGMLSPVLTILTAVTLFGFVPQAPSDTYGLVTRYPDVRAAYAVGETFSLISVILAVAFYLALFLALRKTSLAPALWGTGVSLLGLTVLAAQAAPRVVLGGISDLYHAPGATAQDQATLALIWQTTQSLFLELDTAALIFQATGYILLGIAILRNPAFGKILGGVTIALALAGLAGLYLLGIDSALFAPLGLFVFILLPVLLGWKVYSLSRAVHEVTSTSQTLQEFNS
jgi:hypothetical protein